MNIPGSIFLVGPMGVGKTTIGRHLAQLLSKQFVDADQELEKRTGASISLIFEIEGEDGFRKREKELIAELSTEENVVLATGGGAILDQDNRKTLRTHGYVVYLHADLDTLVKRTYRDRNRPLLQNVDKRETIEKIMQAREPLYRQEADLVVETDERPSLVIAKEIVDKIKAQKQL